MFVSISFSFLLALSIVLRPLDLWSPDWKEFFSGLGSIDQYGLYLAAYALIGIMGHFQELPFSNPMFWRSFLFFCCAFLSFVFWIYPGFDGELFDRIDNRQYVRLLVVSICIGTVVYLTYRSGLTGLS